MRILIVEDNPDFLQFLKFRLEEKSFVIDAVENGAYGLDLAKTNTYDLILLDYSLPEKTGGEICVELRALGARMPIIMISGTATSLPNKIDGFNIGVDDYLVKPFYFEELLARINALLRRPPLKYDPVISFDDVALDTARQTVTRAGISVYLTRKEFALLEYLLRRAGNVASRGELLEHVWDSDTDLFSNTIETHIMNLRKKIDAPRKRKLIHSVPGRGYKLDTKK